MRTLQEPPLFTRACPALQRFAGLSFATPNRTAARLVAVYLCVGTLWILFSDLLLNHLTAEPMVRERIALYKGWFFVAATAAMLFCLLRSRLAHARQQEDKLQLFVTHAPVALAMLDRDLRYITVSRRWQADYGLDDQDLRGRKHSDVFPDMPSHWRESHQRALAGETLQKDADRYQRADGRVQWLRWEVRPWLDGDGRIGGVVIFAEDITMRKNAEEALALSQSRLQVALEAGHVGTWRWDTRNGQIEVDETTARLFGRRRDELLHGGIEFYDSCLHPEDRTNVMANLEKALREDTAFATEYRVVWPDGRVVWLADRGSVERDEAGQALRMIGACVDITEMKRIEHALRDSENRFREVVETIRDVFWVTELPSRRIAYVSPAFEEIWGRPCTDLYDNPRAWAESIHPDDRERVLQAALTNQENGSYDETFRVVRPDREVRWVRSHSYPVRDEKGQVIRVVGVAEDMTERMKLEEQFLRAQRLEAIGTLASGVAHDLNNILAPMFMIAPILRPKLADKSDLDMLSIVQQSGQRGASVVRQLLTFSRGIAGERGPLQARHLVKEMTAIMNETFPREIGIVHEVPSDLWPVFGDATQLHQVLMNLCVNARDAMPDGGKLTITGKNVTLEEAAVRSQTGIKPGKYVILTVGDSGHGIPLEIRTRIFEPFFTTKEIGKGTGLGLSTVIGIVKSHGGFVTLESEVGRGTSFHVHLPAADGVETAGGIRAPMPLAPGKGELVLLVDDEPGVRLAMQQVLERHGYRALIAANGREGLGLYLLQRENIRAIVTDLMMPEMGGIPLIRAVRDLDVELPVIAATGLQDMEKREALLALNVAEILPKPYAAFELLDALKRGLAKELAAA